MKYLFVSFFLIGVVLIGFYSCNKLPCADLACKNLGIKTFDTDSCYCKCPVNTRGEFCEIDLLDSIAGDYSVLESCALTPSNVQISKIDSSKFNAYNLGAYACSSGSYVVSFVVNDSLIRIDSQTVCTSSSGYLFYGKGSLNYDAKTIKLSYYVSYNLGSGNQKDSCTVLYLKL